MLFITHSLSRTGAPIGLLSLLQWIKREESEIEFDVVSYGDGPLKNEFMSISAKLILVNSQPAINRILKIINSILPKGHKITKEYISIIKLRKKYNIIFGNSIATLDGAVKFKSIFKESKLILYVHELERVIKLVSPDIISKVEQIDRYIAASNMVKDCLINEYGVRKDLIDVIYESSDISELGNFDKLKELNYFEVGASGYVHWRKGPDLFIQVARVFFKRFPESKVRFTWVGEISNQNRVIFDKDIELLGLTNKVRFIGEVVNPTSYFLQFDLFIMTSREDPFPLVCIEVGKLGIPIVLFRDATGTEEVISFKEYTTVPYLDVEQMANMVFIFSQDQELRRKVGANNVDIFNQFSSGNMFPVILNLIKGYN